MILLSITFATLTVAALTFIRITHKRRQAREDNLASLQLRTIAALQIARVT